MPETDAPAIETTVKTLLQVGERIIEVSEDQAISRIWDRAMLPLKMMVEDYSGWKYSNLTDYDVILQCSELLAEAFKTGENKICNCSVSSGNQVTNFLVRILTCNPDKKFIFLVLEKQAHLDTPPASDNWLLALDAAGDGIWDQNMVTNTITFSDKWHKTFGYGKNEIPNLDHWKARIHPQDLPVLQKQTNDYLEGITDTYRVEFRFLFSNGNYKWILSQGVIISFDENEKPLRFVGIHTDINDRKLSEEKYLDSVQLLMKLLDNLNSGILVTDEQRQIVFANQMFCDIYNIKESPAQLKGTDFWEGINKRMLIYKQPENFMERTKDLFYKKELVTNEEWELVDGRVFTRDYIPLSLGFNFKGEIWKITDITDQKNTEKRFEQLKDFYECILNNISADVIALDPNYKFLFVSPYAIKDNEVRKWVIGKNDEEYCIHINKPLSLAEGRKQKYETAVRERQIIEWLEKTDSSDGSIKYSMRRICPVFNEKGAIDMIIGYGLNITELIKAEEELKESMDTFEKAFHYSGIGMALIGLDGSWVDVNEVMCQLTGYTKEELLKLNYIDITLPDDDDIDRPLVNQLLKRTRTTYTIEKRYVTKEKKIVLVSLTVSLVWNKDETPKFFIAQVVDITRRKELETELYRQNSVLEATKNSLINKIKQLEDLSHIIAHNLRGPAKNIKMLSQSLIARKKDGVFTPEKIPGDVFTTEEIVDMIEESSEALMNSLATLMEITQIKLNKEIPYNECNVLGIINEITMQLHKMIYEKHAVFNLDIEIKTISYPKAYLENILYNLISNALKYSRSEIPPEITISTTMHEGKVQISVKDNGLGIDLEKYGDRVFKLNQVFHEGFDSKGVGLYLTKTQVESLGGKIELKSVLNEGSEFIVTI